MGIKLKSRRSEANNCTILKQRIPGKIYSHIKPFTISFYKIYLHDMKSETIDQYIDNSKYWAGS